MTHDHHGTKLRRRFRMLDTDGDGFLMQGDYEALGRRIASACAADDPQRAARIAAHFQEVWRHLAATAGVSPDQRIAEEDFVRMHRDGHLHARKSTQSKLLFEMLDADGDGKVKPEVFRAYYQACGVSGEDADHAFVQIDTDKKGFLSPAEIAKASMDFFSSTEGTAPGNHLFGKHS